MTINTTGVHPKGDLLLVRADPIPEMTDGGIVIPDPVRERQGRSVRSGIVVEVGNLARQNPRMEGIVEGDRVLFAKHAGDMLPMDGELYFLLRDVSIVALTTRDPDGELGAPKPSLEVFGANNGMSA